MLMPQFRRKCPRRWEGPCHPGSWSGQRQADMGARYKFPEWRAALNLIRRVMRWRPTPIIPLASFLVTYTTARDHDSCLGGLDTASPSRERCRNARIATASIL